MKKLKLCTAFLTVALLCISAFPLTSTAQVQCSDPSTVSIVLMIDHTSSIDPTELAEEKAAAKDFLILLSALSAKPKVAIGTFNGTYSGGEGYPGAARIHAPLTSSYGTPNPATGLFATLNSIDNYSSNGRTNIEAALNSAQSALQGAGNGAKYIILISDGVPNRPPNDSSCGACGCVAAYDKASAAATNAENQGTKIFGVHFGRNPSCEGEPTRGINFLQASIATTPAYYFPGNGGLSGVLQTILQSITCNDGNVCTADSCNLQTRTCVFTPITTDPQCNIQPPDCFGVHGGRASVDRCGVCGGDGKSCLNCADSDISPLLLALDSNAREQAHLVKSASSRLKQQYPRNNRILTYIRKVNKQANDLFMQSWNYAAAYPHIVSLCQNSVFCATTDNSSVIAKFNANSISLQNLAKQVVSKMNKGKVKVRINTKRYLNSAKALHDENLRTSAKVPTKISVCD